MSFLRMSQQALVSNSASMPQMVSEMRWNSQRLNRLAKKNTFCSCFCFCFLFQKVFFSKVDLLWVETEAEAKDQPQLEEEEESQSSGATRLGLNDNLPNETFTRIYCWLKQTEPDLFMQSWDIYSPGHCKAQSPWICQIINLVNSRFGKMLQRQKSDTLK